MADERFDALAGTLASITTRRGAFGALAGIAGLGFGAAAARKKGKGRRRVSAAAADKVGVCHYDADLQTWVAIRVSRRGWQNGHAKHENDFLQGEVDGCCTDGDCAHLDSIPNCSVGSCFAGSCVARAVDGSACFG